MRDKFIMKFLQTTLPKKLTILHNYVIKWIVPAHNLEVNRFQHHTSKMPII